MRYITCDGNGHVGGIDFGYSNIGAPAGSLGDISGLRYLTSLSLGSYQDVRNYDEWYTGLANLTTLSLAPLYSTYSAMTGFTANFTHNPKLASLAISDNYATTLPSLANITSLRTLNLYTPRLVAYPPMMLQNLNLTSLTLSSGASEFPDFSDMTYLTTLTLQSQAVTVLQDNFTLLTRLTSLNLDQNYALTKLPASISGCTSLQTLSCYYCALRASDSIPPLTNTRISTLNLNYNGMTVLPDGLCYLPTNPYPTNTSLALASTQITDLPACFANNQHLDSIQLSQSKLTVFPAALASISSLTSISLYYSTSMTGTIPDLSALTRLKMLDLRMCNISAPFPVGISSAKSLNYAYLSGNQFTGTLPDNFFQGMNSLYYFYIDGSHLTGAFPSSVGSLPSLYQLTASGNQFTTLPAELAYSKTIFSVDFSNNNLNSIPSNEGWANMTSLAYLYLNGNNALGGALPTFYANRSSIVRIFNVASCSFTGDVPRLNNTYLSKLILSDNALAGTIGDIALATNLVEFSINRNQLTGSLPANIGTVGVGMTSLNIFDVSNNRLSGSFPVSFSNLHSLTVMKFNNNGISGLLPNMAALSTALTTLWGQNTFIRLCDADPGSSHLNQLSSCELFDVTFPGSCGCETWYTNCITNTTCPPPGYVPPPTSGSPPPPTPITPPNALPVTPSSPPPTATPGTDAVTGPTGAAPSSFVFSALLLVASTLLLATLTL